MIILHNIKLKLKRNLDFLALFSLSNNNKTVKNKPIINEKDKEDNIRATEQFFLQQSAHELKNIHLKPRHFNSTTRIILMLLTRPYYILLFVCGIITCLLSYYFYDKSTSFYEKNNNGNTGIFASICLLFILTAITFVFQIFQQWCVDHLLSEKIKNDLLAYILTVDSFCIEGKEALVNQAIYDLPMHIINLTHKASIQLYSLLNIAFIFYNNQDNSENTVNRKSYFTLIMSLYLVITVVVWKYIYDRVSVITTEISNIQGNIAVRQGDIINNRKLIDLFKQSTSEYSKIVQYKALLYKKNNTKKQLVICLALFLLLVNILLCSFYYVLEYYVFKNKSLDQSVVKLFVLCCHVAHFVVNFCNSLEITLLINDTLKVFNTMSISKQITSTNYSTVSKELLIDNIKIYTPDRKLLIKRNVQPIILQPGKIYSIWGKSGAGKSTLMNIIQKLYFNFEGTIKVDNIDIKEINDSQYKDVISIIPQRYELMQRSIRENITFSRQKWHDNQITSIMLDVDLENFLDTIKYDLSHQIVKGGSNISGGQAQRICIARGLYKIEQGAKILIADEPFSALDITSAQKVIAQFQKIAQEKKVIIIIIDHTGIALKKAYKNIVIHDNQIYFDFMENLKKNYPEFVDLYYKS